MAIPATAFKVESHLCRWKAVGRAILSANTEIRDSGAILEFDSAVRGSPADQESTQEMAMESRSIEQSEQRVQARLAYQEQDTRLTLREGLAEYLASNPDLIDTNDTSTGEMAAYFANHDASHVAFGTSTRIEDELIQDIWTLVAIDVKYRNYVGDLVKAKEGIEVAKALPFWGTIKGFFHLLRVVPRLLTCSRKMPKKWPWTGWEPYLDKPLGETRQEFGIRVL